MRIVRSPLRITLGGGGTDLPSWYSQNGGFFISAAINKYVYFTGSERPFDRKYWLSYSGTEICDRVSEIKHELFAKCLERYDLKNGIEIHSVSEVPGKSGLGSSGSFLVGVLYLMNSLKRKDMTRQELAETACQIEMVELQRNSGKQDQYIAAFGGIRSFSLTKNGEVTVEKVDMNPITLKRLQNNLLIYFSGFSRDAPKILTEQSNNIASGAPEIQNAMKRIQQIGYESLECLKGNDLDSFGTLMNDHWKVKKSFSQSMSNSTMDELYDSAISFGALGGKTMGAGGGGFFLFYVPEQNQLSFREKMSELGHTELEWQFDFDGCSLVYSN